MYILAHATTNTALVAINIRVFVILTHKYDKLNFRTLTICK